MTTKTDKRAVLEGIETASTIKDTRDGENDATTELSRLSDVGLMIGSRWKVAADDMNVIVCRKRTTKDSSIRWDAEGYFATVSGALHFLVEQSIRDTQLKDLQTIVAKVEELKRDVDEALKAVSK